MKFTSENATFFQSGFNFYIGDVIEENTIIFNEDYIVIGNLKSEKNVFAMGELIVIGDIDCKSIYVTKDFLNLGNIKSELVEVEGNKKILDKSILSNMNITDIMNHKKEEDKEEILLVQENIDKSNINDVKKINKSLQCGEKLLNEIEERKDLREIHKKYLSKKGELIEGKVFSVSKDKAIIDLGDTKACIQIDNNEISIGTQVYAYIKSVTLDREEISIILENKDRSYLTKVINRELNKNKYDLSKIYFKNIEINNDNNVIVTILSEQLNDASLNIIEQKISKYFYKRIVKLNLYRNEVKFNKDESYRLLDTNNKNTEDKNIKGFRCGDKVLHNKFGEGKILNIVDIQVAEIDFNGIVKSINIPILVNKGLIRKKEDTDKNIIKHNETTLDYKSKNSNEYININNSKISVASSKKHTLVTGIVTKVGTKTITLKIDKNIIGILDRKDDIRDDIIYNIGDEVSAYVSNIYMKNEKIELHLIKNNSNYFKLLFEKYKEYLDLKNCNLKLCKYLSSMGALLIVDKKYKFTEQDILVYIIQLMNKASGFNVVRVVDYVYDPYIFLSNIFEVSEKDIYNKGGVYYIYNKDVLYPSEIQSLCDDIEKMIKCKIQLNYI